MAWHVDTSLSDHFRRDLAEVPAAGEILELGTLRWEADKPTHHKAWHAGADWTMSDWEAGTDVDVVADAHNLAPFEDDRFDALIACSLLEHVARPWLVLQAMARVLRPGGLLYVTTHQTFPLHGYPDDYFRFSTSAMTVLAEDAELEIVRVEHVFPCTIIPHKSVPVWNKAAEAFMNVELYARKKAA